MIGAQCPLCKNRITEDACIAFPEGIPPEILRGEFDHSVPWPGQDNDTLYEPLDDNSPEEAASVDA